jgi:parallel beta-helix repeat protein
MTIQRFLLLALGILFFSGISFALSCGDTIYTSVTLASDLGPCNTAYALMTGEDDIVVDCAGYTIYGNGTNIGIKNSPASQSNITIKNCNFQDFEYAVYLAGGVYDSTVSNNDAYNCSQACFYLLSSHDNTFTLNTAMDSAVGFHLENSLSNVLYLNTANNNTIGFFLSNSDGNDVSGNDADDNSDAGFAFQGSDLNVLSANTAYNSGDKGVWLIASSNNTLTSNKVSGGSSPDGAGFYLLYGSANNTLTGNIAFDSDEAAFRLEYGCNDNTFTYNVARDSNMGYYVFQGIGNNFTYNNAYNNSIHGFYFDNSLSNTLTNNTAYDNVNGFYLYKGADNTLSGNTARDNGAYGTRINDANRTTITDDHYYGNKDDFNFRSTAVTGLTVSLSGVVFDNPAGGLSNYTNISMDDVLGATLEEYNMGWTSSPAPNPGYESFAGKFINITPALGTPSIDSITWHWLENETTGYNESKFWLWKWNGTWSMLNNTPDTSANTLSLSDLEPSSVFAILYATVPDDSDGDGVPDDEDACPDTPGNPDWQGCPYADEVEVKMHIVDVAGTGACPGPGNSCWVYPEGVEVRVYDREDPTFIAKWTSHPDAADLPEIFADEIGLVGSCTTNASGVCTAGEEEPGEYLVLGKYYDEAEDKTVYISAYKNADDFVEGLATKDLQFMKQIKNNGQVDYKPISQVHVEGEESAGKDKGKPAKTEEPSLGLILAVLAILLVAVLFIIRRKQ